MFSNKFQNPDNLYNPDFLRTYFVDYFGHFAEIVTELKPHFQPLNLLRMIPHFVDWNNPSQPSPSQPRVVEVAEAEAAVVVVEMKVVVAVVDWAELAFVAPGFSALDIFSDEQPALHIEGFLKSRKYGLKWSKITKIDKMEKIDKIVS